MNRTLLKGLVTSLAAGAALMIAGPSIAAPHHDGRVVIRSHGGMHGGHFRFNRFHTGHVNRLTVVERDRWRGGHWWHGAHHGRVGWWWSVGGLWYWYPEAVYPYPTYISTTASYDYAPQGYSEDSWYYCQSAQAYYPYVRSCDSEWQRVPISPQARNEADYGQPPTAYNDGGSDGSYDDGDYNDDDSYSDEDNDSDDYDDDSNY